jgi:adenylate cyclase
VLVLGVIVLLIAWIDGRGTLVETGHEVMQSVSSDVGGRVEQRLEAPRRALLLTVELLERDAIPPGDLAKMEAYLRDFLTVHETVSALRYVTVAGGAIGAVRVPGGTVDVVSIEVSPMPDGEPENEWFEYWTSTSVRARPGAAVHWGPVTVRQDLQAPAVTGSLPVHNESGAMEGVVGVEVSLIDLSRYLATLNIGTSGHAFLTTAGGSLVASPDTAALVSRGGAAERFRLLESAFANGPGMTDFTALPDVRSAYAERRATRVRFSSDGTGYLGALAPVGPLFDEPWFVGIIVPEDDYLGRLKRMIRFGLLAVVLVVVLGAVGGTRISGHLAAALDSMVAETQAVSRLEFADSGPVQSRFQETYEALSAFSTMKAGLRSFSQYVPAQIVRRLIASGVEARPGGETREVTVMFSDIENFSTISEYMDPGVLAARLSDYFSILTGRIQAPESGGIVDKYIGDAIMAFWGAPEPEADHAAHACAAALACGEALRAADPPDDGVTFRNRTGLHTERVLVGNIGAVDRLEYTAIGDGVNLASRVEGLNRDYGTSILVTDPTRAAAGPSFEFRRIDRVVVKGRSRSIVIHELMGLTGSVPEGVLNTARQYEKALEHFENGRFSESSALLVDLAATDAPSARLLARCS